MSDNLLNHPHSRFIASTNYLDHAKLFEEEIISKKKDFDSFFDNFIQVKKNYNQYKEMVEELNKKKEKLEQFKKNHEKSSAYPSFAKRFIAIGVNEGKYFESKSILLNTSEAINSYTSEIKNQINNIKIQKKLSPIEKSDKGEKSDPFDDIRGTLNDELNKIFKLENDCHQSVLDNVEKQILDSNTQINSEYSFCG